MATTVIDSLVVQLGLDPSRFNQGQKDAMNALQQLVQGSQRGGKEIEAQGIKTAEFFSTMKRSALGMLAVFLGGREIKEFVGYVTNLDASTSRLARTMDMSTRELSIWQGVMTQNGGSAESMTSSLGGLTSEMNKFVLTGQTSMLPVLNQLGIGLYDQNKNLKTSGQLFLELADAMQGMDPARASALLSMIPGMNQDTINLILQGRKAIEAYREDARKAGTTTEESAAAAREYQHQMSLLERSSTSLGRSLLMTVLPALNAVTAGVARFMQSWNIAPGSPEDVAQSGEQRAKLVSKFGSPRKFVNDIGKLFGHAGAGDRIYGADNEDTREAGLAMLAARMKAGTTPAAAGSAGEMETYIRAAAAKRGIDPDVAVSVAKSEGLFSYVGDRGSSFGPYQLHYGGVAGGGMSVGGLGDRFTKKTGLDARDSSTWKAQVDFSLDTAGKEGWGAWHGWKGLPYQGIGGLAPGAAGAAAAGPSGGGGGGRQSSNTTTVGTVVVHTQATDAEGIARDIKPAIERLSWASQSDSGLV
jgi:hypothetical protein